MKNGRFAYVWDLKAEKLLRRIDNADWNWQGFCAFTPDGLLALADKEKLRFFDPATQAPPPGSTVVELAWPSGQPAQASWPAAPYGWHIVATGGTLGWVTWRHAV